MSNMPERILIALSGLTYICPAWSKDQDATEYTRTDLVPTWKDYPDAPGYWVKWYDNPTKEFGRVIYIADHTQSWVRGKWYGPIPPDTKEEVSQ